MVVTARLTIGSDDLPRFVELANGMIAGGKWPSRIPQWDYAKAAKYLWEHPWTIVVLKDGVPSLFFGIMDFTRYQNVKPGWYDMSTSILAYDLTLPQAEIDELMERGALLLMNRAKARDAVVLFQDRPIDQTCFPAIVEDLSTVDPSGACVGTDPETGEVTVQRRLYDVATLRAAWLAKYPPA